MQIVIDIPENEYDVLKNIDKDDPLMDIRYSKDTLIYLFFFIVNAAKNGIVLPEGHGDLIDRDALYAGPHFVLDGKTTVGDKDFGFRQFDMFVREDIDKMQAVVPADLVKDSQELVKENGRWITDEELDDIIYDAFVTTDIDAIAEMQEAYAERKRNECQTESQEVEEG